MATAIPDMPVTGNMTGISPNVTPVTYGPSTERSDITTNVRITTTSEYSWKFCYPDFDSPSVLPPEAIDYPDTYFYYLQSEGEEGCYCLNYCPYDFYPTRHAARFIYAYIAPIIFTGGCTGNLLILAMFFTKHLQSMPSKPIFQALAISDTIALLSGLLVHFMWEGYGIYGRYNAAACKLRVFATYASSASSAWLVAALTADRFICINWPMKASLIRYKHRVIAIVIIYFSMSLSKSFMLYYEGYEHSCKFQIYGEGDETFRHFYFTYNQWFAMALDVILPFIVIVVCNTGMVYALRKSEGGDIESTKSEDTLASKRLARLAILVGTVFIVASLPMQVYTVFLFYSEKYSLQFTWTFRWFNIDKLMVALCRCFFYTNYACNILLYCVFGSKFRSAFMSIVKWRPKFGGK